MAADRLKNAAATKKLAIFDAFDILNKIYSQKRYKAIDIMYGNIGAKQYFNYPGSFREEGDISQITPNKTKIQTEDYEFISMKKYNAKSKSI